MTECYIQDAAGPCHCDNCDWKGDAEALDMIGDIQERLSAGGVVPAGECPACGALAYLDKAPDWARQTVDLCLDLLAIVEATAHLPLDGTAVRARLVNAASEAVAKAKGST